MVQAYNPSTVGAQPSPSDLVILCLKIKNSIKSLECSSVAPKTLNLIPNTGGGGGVRRGEIGEPGYLNNMERPQEGIHVSLLLLRIGRQNFPFFVKQMRSQCYPQAAAES